MSGLFEMKLMVQMDDSQRMSLNLHCVAFFDMVKNAALGQEQRLSTPSVASEQKLRLDEAIGPRHDLHDTSRWADLDIIQKYCTYVNNVAGSTYHPGEDGLRPLVYHVCHLLQKERVESIKKTHAELGKNWGNLTTEQKVDLFQPVKDWYVRFDFGQFMPDPKEHALLPKDTPGY